MESIITYVAMDTHKKQHKIALHYPEMKEIVEFSVNNTARDIKRMVKKIQKQAKGVIKFCYEAGVCGFDLKRKIESLGCQCIVIAPSLVPYKPGERIKTDRRDARKLLANFQAGLLTEVAAPDPASESARELVRLREGVRENLKRARHQLLKFLTRHGYIYSTGKHWTVKHIAWLRGIKFTDPVLNEVFAEYFDEMQRCVSRLEGLDERVGQLAASEPYAEIVGILRCFHGIDTLTAISILVEIFDFSRFPTARSLMSYLGIVPSEYSSGDKQSKGSITKTGNKRARRLLIESAWHYRHIYSPSKALRARRKGQPQYAIQIADDAGRRLTKRYRHLTNRGKSPHKVTVAVARELSGFIWFAVNQYYVRQRKSTEVKIA